MMHLGIHAASRRLYRRGLGSVLAGAVLAPLLLFLPASPAAARDTAASGGTSVAETVKEALGVEETDPNASGEDAEPSETGREERTKHGGGGKNQDTKPDQTTPRGAMSLYLEACRDGDFRSASGYLDLGRSAAEPGTKRAGILAWRLKVVLDQTLWIDLEGLSDAPEGDLEDGSRRRDILGTIDTDRGPVKIWLERQRAETGATVWKISSSTVARIPYLYEQFGYGPLGEHLPDFFFTVTLLTVQLWQWLGMLLLALAAYLVSWITVWILTTALRPAVKRTRTGIDDRIVNEAGQPVRVLMALALFWSSTPLLRLAVPAQSLLSQLEKAGVVVVFTWLIMRLVDVVSGVIKSRLESQDHRSGLAVLPLGRRTFKAIIVVLAIIAIMQNLGFNVTGLIASLGIGGLAVALAAQRSLENMFAGLSLISDQPVRVGDFCRFGDTLGWVEDIGLRSTKIRTLERSVLAVPNSEFAKLQLDNLARRDYIRLYTVLGLRYETTADQLRHVILELRRMLVAHPKVSLDPFWRVRFIGMGDYSLNVEIFVYTRTTDYGEFRAIQEDILLRVIDIVEASGTGIAFPSQTAYLGRDGGIDTERGDEVVKKISSLRDKDELPFPDFSEETLEELKDTLDYPPRGAREEVQQASPERSG